MSSPTACTIRFVLAYAQLKPDQNIDEAQQILLKTAEGLVAEPLLKRRSRPGKDPNPEEH